MLNYEWYRSFAAIYRLGTLTAAAEERGLTQPAMTQHLAGLEAAVGEPLFTRTARRMAPTERGKALYSAIAPALELLDHAAQQMHYTRADPAPQVRLGAPREYFSAVALERLAQQGIRITARFGTARALLDALREGALDAVIATERLSLPEVEYRKVMEETFVLVAGTAAAQTAPVIEPGSAQAQADFIDWALAQPWVSYGSDLPIIRRFWRQNMRSRPAITPRLIIPDLQLIAQAVVAGHGISVLPSYLCAEAIAAGRLVVLWEPDPPVTNELWLAYRIRDRQRPFVRLVLERLTENG